MNYCHKCGSSNLSILEDGSGLCLDCNNAFADVNKQMPKRENIEHEKDTEQAQNIKPITEPFRFEFRYELIKQDNEMAYNAFVRNKNAEMKAMIPILLLSIIFLIVTLILIMDAMSCVIYLVCLFIILLGLHVNLPLKFMMWLKPEKYLINTPINLTIDNNKIVFVTSMRESRFTWKHVKNILKEADGILILALEKSGLYIPKRAFKSNEEFNTFYEKTRDAQYIAWNHSRHSYVLSRDAGEISKELNFKLTIKDHDIYWTHSILMYSSKRNTLVVASIIFILSSIVLAFVSMSNSIADFMSLFWAWTLIFLILFAFNLIRRINIRISPSHYTVDMPRKLSIEKENLIVQFGGMIDKFSWKSIKDIKTSKGYIYFQVGSNESFILPKRAFKDKSECDDFMQKARSFHQVMQAR